MSLDQDERLWGGRKTDERQQKEGREEKIYLTRQNSYPAAHQRTEENKIKKRQTARWYHHLKTAEYTSLIRAAHLFPSFQILQFVFQPTSLHRDGNIAPLSSADSHSAQAHLSTECTSQEQLLLISSTKVCSDFIWIAPLRPLQNSFTRVWLDDYKRLRPKSPLGLISNLLPKLTFDRTL